MARPRKTVVAKPNRLNKPQLHAMLMLGWSRAIARIGKGAFADTIEVTGAGLDKQLSGSMPTFEAIDRAFDEDPAVLDDWLAAKRKRIVDIDAVCDVDDVSLLLARLNLKLQEAEHPDSPGGRHIIHTELLPMESDLRAVQTVIGSLLERIASLRGLRAVA